MHLRRCPPSPALIRHAHRDVAALSNAIRGFHISAARHDSEAATPLVSARARSVAASKQIQSLKPKVLTQTSHNYKQVGLAGGAFASGQNKPAPRVIRSRDGKEQTPRPNFRMQTHRAPPGSFKPRDGLGARGGPGARGKPKRGAGANPKGRSRRPRQTKEEEVKEVGLSDTMLRYLLDLKAERRMIKTYTPHETTREELLKQAAVSASLGQPGGAVQLLESRLRYLAERKEMEPVGLYLQARRLVKGEFVKFADEKERDAVLALVQEHQEQIAAMLSEKKGETIQAKPIEFEETKGTVREKTTEMMITGKYELQQGGEWKDVVIRALQHNGSYVGPDKEKFLGRLNAITAA